MDGTGLGAGELDDLTVLLAVVDAGSFAAAARQLRRDPTSLSRRLQALEKRLGVRLAERSTRQFVLTEAGVAYCGRVRPLIAELNAANREAASYSVGRPRGRLRVSLPGSFARLWLNPMIVRFMAAYPDVTIEASYTNTFVDLIGEGYDVAVRLGELADSRLVSRKIATRRRLVCASPSYLSGKPPILKPGDVAGLPCLCFTGRKKLFRWDFVGLDGDHTSIQVRCTQASDDADLLVEAALAGLGLFYTTDWHVGPHLASGSLVEVLPGWQIADDGAIYVVTPARDVPTKTRAFSDWITDGLLVPPWLSTSYQH